MNVQTVKKNKLPLLIHREEKLANPKSKTMHTSESVQKKTSCVVHFLKGEEAPVKRIHYLVSACRFLSQSYFSFVAFAHFYFLPSFVVVIYPSLINPRQRIQIHHLRSKGCCLC